MLLPVATFKNFTNKKLTHNGHELPVALRLVTQQSVTITDGKVDYIFNSDALIDYSESSGIIDVSIYDTLSHASVRDCQKEGPMIIVGLNQTAYSCKQWVNFADICTVKANPSSFEPGNQIIITQSKNYWWVILLMFIILIIIIVVMIAWSGLI